MQNIIYPLRNKIREYTTDPVSTKAGSNWVVRTGSGSPIGLLLSLTQATDKYLFSFKTLSGEIKRTELN